MAQMLNRPEIYLNMKNSFLNRLTIMKKIINTTKTEKKIIPQNFLGIFFYQNFI